MASRTDSGFGFSEEVHAYLKVHEQDLVRAVVYDGDDLHAHAKFLTLKKRKVEMKGYVDALDAMPFRDLDDDELRQVNSRITTDDNMQQDGASEDEPHFWCDSEDGWGTSNGSSNASIDDSCDFFGRPVSSYNDWFAADYSVSSNHSEESESPFGTVQSSSEWDPSKERRLLQEQMAALKRRLEWKFPKAFEGNERTVGHTDADMLPYMEAADFLIGQARRKRSAWMWQQRQAFNDITRVNLTEEQRRIKSPGVDWGEVARDLDARLAKRKMHTKSPLRNAL